MAVIISGIEFDDEAVEIARNRLRMDERAFRTIEQWLEELQDVPRCNRWAAAHAARDQTRARLNYLDFKLRALVPDRDSRLLLLASMGVKVGGRGGDMSGNQDTGGFPR